MFILNLTKEATTIHLRMDGADSVLTGQRVAPSFVLEPMGVEILEVH
ncbi:Beta-galactosidase C-terminal domain [Burkholderia gladioli]